jgi:hypothetical protein
MFGMPMLAGRTYACDGVLAGGMDGCGDSVTDGCGSLGATRMAEQAASRAARKAGVAASRAGTERDGGKYFFIPYGRSIVLWTTFAMDSSIASSTMFQPVHKE